MILEFLGGAAFRALTGQVMSMVSKYQDHKHEKEMTTLQMEMEERRAELQINQQELAAKLQVQVVEVQKEAAIEGAEAQGWAAAVAASLKPTGIVWVDAWNGAVRPAFATLCLYLWLAWLASNGWKMTVHDWELMGLVVGFFFADRQMKRVGK